MPTELPSTLDQPTQAALLMALLGFVLLGIGLVVGVMLGGRWVRRLKLSKSSEELRPNFKSQRIQGDLSSESSAEFDRSLSNDTRADLNAHHETELE